MNAVCLSPIAATFQSLRSPASFFSAKIAKANSSAWRPPVPPKFDTRLVVRRKGGELIVAALLSTYPKNLQDESVRSNGSVEILFDLRNDGYGYLQLIFQKDHVVFTHDFSPYPEAKSTRYKLPAVRRWGFEAIPSTDPSHFVKFHTVFYAVFSEKEIFAYSPTVGFNLCRQDANTGEFSSWNFMAGCGSPDATSLGKLHRDKKSQAPPRRVPPFPAAKNFRISITNDTPMMICNQAYTPEALDSEMGALRKWGIHRLHWIDYSNYPAFWAARLWDKNYAATEKACGILLDAACRAAKKHKVELVPDFKLFDLGFTARENGPREKKALPFVEGLKIKGIPEMSGNEDAFMQTNPAWRREVVYPIKTLRLYSMEPLPKLKAPDIRLFRSADNADYQPLRCKSLKAEVHEIARPNRRWTPAGVVREKGAHRAWVLELSGLHITGPYLEISIQGVDGSFQNRHFALLEAIGADGREAPFVCTDAASHKNKSIKYDFFGKWPGWNNYNEHVVERTKISFGGFCIAFIEPPALTGMLEPTHPVSQKIWLDRVDWYLERDIAGISIRTLCHHRRCQSWLQYAFAPCVIAEFTKRHGRPPENREEDFISIRKIRGDAMGEFLSESAGRIRRRRKKCIFQVEVGGELPATHESRMAMYYDYEKWIASGWFDELHVRSITGHSPWLRQVILPLARKHGVEVHLITRNQNKGLDLRDYVEIQKSVSDAKAMGYHGLNFYESANLYEMGPFNNFLPKAMADECVREAVRLAKA